MLVSSGDGEFGYDEECYYEISCTLLLKHKCTFLLDSILIKVLSENKNYPVI